MTSRVVTAVACFLAVSTWSPEALACGGNSGALQQALLVMLSAVAVGVSAMFALFRGGQSLRRMAAQRPTKGLQFAANVTLGGFVLVTVFTVLSVLAIPLVIH